MLTCLTGSFYKLSKKRADNLSALLTFELFKSPFSLGEGI